MTVNVADAKIVFLAGLHLVVTHRILSKCFVSGGGNLD